MSKSVRKPKASKAESFSAGMFSVDGRLFSTRAAALVYCKAERISAYRIELAPPVDLDALKLSVREPWTLHVLFDAFDASGSSEPVVHFRHGTKSHAFTVRFSDLLDLSRCVKARVRELAREVQL